LIAAREASDLTQRQLSKKLRRGNSFVWKFEAGERRLDVLEFIELAQLLGLKASALIKKIEDV
jgi:transcriptional regulator with XRE-family HTH domain